jgi:hypothetical protein
MLVRSEGIEADSDKAGGCFFIFMTAGMSPGDADAFLSNTVRVWNQGRDEAESGNEDMQEWRSNLYTAVSGQLLTGVQDIPNLRNTDWNAMFRDLGGRLIELSASA